MRAAALDQKAVHPGRLLVYIDRHLARTRSRPIKRRRRRLAATTEECDDDLFEIGYCRRRGHAGELRDDARELDASAAWATIDLNNDGSLSLDELEQQRAMGLLQDLPNADTNHDGQVTRQEWDAWWPRMTDHYVRASTAEIPPLETAR
jgi:hypothetical protein